MWTVLEVATGETAKIDGTDPALFDTEIEALDWAAARGLVAPEWTVEEV